MNEPKVAQPDLDIADVRSRMRDWWPSARAIDALRARLADAERENAHLRFALQQCIAILDDTAGTNVGHISRTQILDNARAVLAKAEGAGNG